MSSSLTLHLCRPLVPFPSLDIWLQPRNSCVFSPDATSFGVSYHASHALGTSSLSWLQLPHHPVRANRFHSPHSLPILMYVCARVCMCVGAHACSPEVDVFLASSAPHPVSQVSLTHVAPTTLSRRLAALRTLCTLVFGLESQADLHSHAALRWRSKDLNPGPYAIWQGLSALSKFTSPLHIFLLLLLPLGAV